MILSYDDLLNLWKKGKIKFNPDIDKSQIGESSIDLRLSNKISKPIKNPGVTIRPPYSIPNGIFNSKEIKENESIKIKPGELLLALTLEEVIMPSNLAAQVQGKSTLARYGLAVHITSPHIHPCWRGQVTLELYNHGPNELEFSPGEPVCQLIFFKVSKPVRKEVAKVLSRYIGQKKPLPLPYKN